MTHHPNFFIDTGLEAHPFKKIRKEIQIRLGTGRPGWGKKAVVGVKERHQPLDRLLKTVWYRFLPLHQREPVMNHCVNHHVKYGGG